MSRRTQPIACPCSQFGVTLIELMIAVTLGLLVTGAIVQVFIGNRETYAFNEGLSRLQENGRFAVDTLSYRIRLAGYFGCLWGIPVTNNLNSAGDISFNFEQGLAGFEASGTGAGELFSATAKNPANGTDADDWSPALPADLVGSVVPGSDVIVVRSGSSASHSLMSPFSTAGSVFVNATADEYRIGEIAIAADCQQASVFQVTSVTDSGSGIRLDHVATGTPGNATVSWGTNQQYGSGAELLKAETWIYYVGARGDGEPPSLFQRRLEANAVTVTAAAVPEEIVGSVDTLQALYGIDAALDGAVDEYVTADLVTDWSQVVTVRIGLVVRSPQEYGTETNFQSYDVNGTTFDPVDDRRERQVFTISIALRNRLP